MTVSLRTTALMEDIKKAEANILKLQGTLQRHEKQKAKPDLSDYEVRSKEDDIKRTNKKIEQQQERIAKTQEKLDAEIAKMELIEREAPKALIDFTYEWKELAREWNLQHYEKYMAFKKRLSAELKAVVIECIETTEEYSRYRDENGKADDYTIGNYLNLFPRAPMETVLKEKKLDYKSIKMRHFDMSTAITRSMEEIRDGEKRLAWLDKTLERERVAKLEDLFYRIYSVTGTILDGMELQISPKGNLDGIVKGERATVEVSTIGAGGFNIQCFHYRTLVKVLADK